MSESGLNKLNHDAFVRQVCDEWAFAAVATCSSDEVRKSLQPTDKAKKKPAKKSKGIAKAKPFPSAKPPQPTTSDATSQATSNSAVGS